MITPGPENIAGVINDWLRQEVEQSNTGRNAPLSDFAARQADFSKSFNDPTNINALKVKSHHDRLKPWAHQYAAGGGAYDDWATARLTFTSLKFISGGYREQCLLESKDTDSYLRMRHQQGPSSVDVVGVAADELAYAFALRVGQATRIRTIVDRTLAANETNLAVHKFIHADAASLATGAYSDLTAVEAVRFTQSLWTSLAVAQIMVAASVREYDYAKVPLLEPASLSESTRVQYPFA